MPAPREIMDAFYRLLHKQLSSFFFVNADELAEIDEAREEIDTRFLNLCAHLKNKYYSNTENLTPLHSCQYTMFLYFTANTLFQRRGKRLEICDKIYNLSKICSAADLYYEIELPEIFMFDHPVAAVMGRARYGNYFSFSQGCTVGNNHGFYPSFGEFVVMHSNSKVLGKCQIGNNVIISANTYVKDIDIPDNSMVFSSYETYRGGYI